MRSLCALSVSALLALLAAGAVPAAGDVFGPIELASTSAPAGGPHEQADGAIFPVLSADGRYLAFAGSYEGVEGIWRRDLLSGAIEQVAAGDATLPSISAEGRYISFTTTEQLAPGDTNNSPDVYVRDMDPGAGEPEYTLVSAVNGTEEGAQYSFIGSEVEGEYGSIASGRSAISANGQEVAFITTAESNLLGPGEATPPLEVLVRNLRTRETKVVSAEYEPLAGRPANGDDRPVKPQFNGGERPYGAVFPGGQNTPRFAELDPEAAAENPHENVWVGASISADGSTVAWMGQDLEEQTQLLVGEQAAQNPVLAEPLWRRIEGGPSAPIRRVTGGSDPLAPLCAGSGESESAPSLLDPCAGPFEHYREEDEGLWGSKVKADFVPQLSADGTTVAFITGARELAGGEVQFQGAESTDDLYLVNMADGLSRIQALRRLTAIGGGGTQELLEKSSKIIDYAVSPDGSEVAFTTERTQFPLGSPAYVSAPAAAPGMIELFDADLENDTLTRVTHGFQGEDRRSEQLPIAEVPGEDPYHDEQGAYSPSFSADGNTLSFASTANNLVFGDGNGAPDAFVVHRIPPTFATVSQYVSSPPPGPVLSVPWTLGVTAVSLANGRVRLDVDVPGAGSLSAAASAAVRVRVGARRASANGHGRRARYAVAKRRVASASVAVPTSSDGLVPLTLTLAPSYRPLAGGLGLSTSVALTFTAAGHPALHAAVSARFLLLAGPKQTSHAAARRRNRRRAR